MNKPYTIEELKAKVLIQFNENEIEYGSNSITGGYIDDKLNKVVECFDKAFKEMLVEKLNKLSYDNRDGWEQDEFSKEDLEELFNIKLK